VEQGLHRIDIFKANYRLKSFNILVPPDTTVTREVTLAEDLGPNAPPTAPGQVFRDCPDIISGKHVCPEMVVIPPGTFIMGAEDSELTGPEQTIRKWTGRQHEEGPPHPVTISYPFAVGRFAVTFDDWDACVADRGCWSRPFVAPWGRGRQPMIIITWYDTQKYVAWLSRKTGKAYRLLSEAEWEYAARAGTTTPYYTGDYITSDQANFDNYCNLFCNKQLIIHPNANERLRGNPGGVFRWKTLEVGSFAPNDFGLYDMAGNVAQWVQNCWKRYDDPKPATESVMKNCPYRVLRGGGYSYPEFEVRSAYREAASPDTYLANIGFRVGRALDNEVDEYP
jgi:formylglycine-generating enzyme required for sulfatase activity